MKGFLRLVPRLVVISTIAATAVDSAAGAEEFAEGSFLSGNKLHDLCRKEKVTASSYIIGLTDTFLYIQRSTKVRYFCLPKNVDSEQITDVICQSLATEPATRNRTAPSLTSLALRKAWPCP